MSSKRKLAFTFDDGMLSNYTFTAKVLKEYGFSATFFVTAVGRLWDDTELEEPQISWSQLHEMDRDGFEIANHTYLHYSVESLTPGQLERSIRQMEVSFAQKNFAKPRTLSYPAFRCTAKARAVVKAMGYKYARVGYKPNKSNEWNFQKNLACAPWDRKEVSYYVPGETDPYMIFVTGIINGNVRNPCYTSELFIEDIKKAPEGAVPIFAGHGMPIEIRQKAFVEMVEYCAKNDWKPVALEDI